MEPSAEEKQSSRLCHEDGDVEPCSYAMQLVTSSVLPMVMHTSIELGLFDIIAKLGQASASEIASRLPTKNQEAPIILDRMLYLLTTHSVLSCSAIDGDERVYALTPVSKYFASNQDGVSFGPLLALIQDKVFMDSWSQLKNAIIEGGIPFNRVHGSHAFEYPGKDPRFNQVFNTAMFNHTTVIVNKILESYKGFEHLTRVVDVGGGLGTTLSIITSKYPHIEAINFDLPHVIEHAVAYPGVKHIGGDMFESVPKGDAIFMKWILHDWSDDHCLKLLKNCYKALPEHGKVIVVEGVLPEIPEKGSTVKAICQTDLIMLTQNPGGKERTRKEFLDLAIGAGFAGIRYECYVSCYWVMEIFK
ncbi:caffeic acid 3-O-methyltransferase-like [Vitis riparia]|uniref:caffeic acid 3-O-methyltransferase-like n=1 Tax=Vitis riparia TaxID=96939 RepID=UPI00155B1D3A|nr:caffeic acid 3-O-methyltransferase-like [Vitis riparia]